MSAVVASDISTRRTNLKEIPLRSTLQYTERFSKENLDAWRLVGDPLGDHLVDELHSKHGGLTQIHGLLQTVQKKAAEVDGPDGDVFRNFMAETAKIPPWADRAMVERGQRVHATHLPFMGLSLFSGSLVGGAQYSIAASVTALAGNITTNPTRRIDETGALLMALAFPGSLVDQGSEAHDSLTQVRLLHSALRHWLPRSGRLRNLPKIVPESVYVEGELPINQEDLAITLGVFCYINLRSLRLMNVVLSSYDIQCYVHMWRYAGYVLGIHEELLPKTIEDQEEFMLCAMLHQGVPEWIDADRIKEFIDAFAKQASDATRVVPYQTFQTFLYQMTRYLNGNDYIGELGIDDLGDSHWSVRTIKTLGFIHGTLIPRLPFGESALFHLHSGHVRRMMNKKYGGGIPTGHGAGTGHDVTEVVKSSKL